MSTTPTPETNPDVVALDADGGVIFIWQGCPDIEKISELPGEGLAGMAIKSAHTIRRRDGFVIKSRDGFTGWPQGHPNAEESHLERVDLIPHSDTLDAVDDHTGLPAEVLFRLGLWKAIMAGEDGFVAVEDRDIVKAMERGQISVERNEKEGLTIFRAHMAGVTTYRINGEDEDAGQ